MKFSGSLIKGIEYILMLLLIISTRTLYVHSNFNPHINILFVIFISILIILKYMNNEFNYKQIGSIIKYLMIYYVFISIFILLNNISDLSNFISTFLILLPLFFAIIYCDNDKLWLRKNLSRYSDLMTIIAFTSIILYILGPLTNIIKSTNMFFTEWGDPRFVKSYFNIHFITQNISFFGINIVRNTSIFTEAPMFSLNLIIALATNLFISSKKHFYKNIILIVAILTTFSATGILLLLLMLVGKGFVSINNNDKIKKIFKEHKKKIYVLLIIIFSVGVTVFAVKVMNGESFSVRMDDYYACIKTWLQKPIFGVGHNQTGDILKNISSFRLNNIGLSNSIFVLLAQCGIYLFLFYVVPIVLIIRKYILEKKFNELLFVIILVLLFVTTIFQYTIIAMFFLASMYGILLRKNEKKVYENDIKIYVITHKKFDPPKDEIYIPIQVGSKNKEKLGFICDDTGDNISSKNKNYCELTGLYWIWKNIKDKNSIIGISHYRRYFTTDIIFKRNILSKDEINEIFDNYNMVLAKKEIYSMNSYKQYCRSSGFAKDLDLIREIINKQKNKKYIEAFDKLMKQNKMSQFNMMITTKEKYDEYCKWLFDILFKLEKKIDLTDYNDYQKRIYGFISERLLNVWVLANKDSLKVKYLSVFNTEEPFRKVFIHRFRRLKHFVEYKIKNK